MYIFSPMTNEQSRCNITQYFLNIIRIIIPIVRLTAAPVMKLYSFMAKWREKSRASGAKLNWDELEKKELRPVFNDHGALSMGSMGSIKSFNFLLGGS